MANRLVQRPMRTHSDKLAGFVAKPHDVAGDREVHDGHADNAGKDQALGAAFALQRIEFLASRGVVGVRDVTDVENALEYLAELDALGVPAHPGVVAGVVEFDIDHPVEAAQHALVQPQAGGAADVFQQKRCLAGIRAVADERLLNLGMIVKIQLAHDLGHDIGGNGLFAPVLVILLEAGVDDAACHRQAAVAAEMALLAQHRGGFPENGVQGQAAVEATVRLGGCRRRGPHRPSVGGRPADSSRVLGVLKSGDGSWAQVAGAAYLKTNACVFRFARGSFGMELGSIT